MRLFVTLWRRTIRGLLELVRRADAGERIVDTFDFSQTPETNEDDSSEEKIEALAEIICRAGDESAAALLVLMGTLENSTNPKVLANTAKHFAFTRCGELNLFGMVDAQIAVVEGELLAGDPLDPDLPRSDSRSPPTGVGRVVCQKQMTLHKRECRVRRSSFSAEYIFDFFDRSA